MLRIFSDIFYHKIILQIILQSIGGVPLFSLTGTGGWSLYPTCPRASTAAARVWKVAGAEKGLQPYLYSTTWKQQSFIYGSAITNHQ